MTIKKRLEKIEAYLGVKEKVLIFKIIFFGKGKGPHVGSILQVQGKQSRWIDPESEEGRAILENEHKVEVGKSRGNAGS